MNNKILLIEDTESLREVLSAVLVSEGYEVTSIVNAEEGLNAFKGNEYQLVLTDLKLPNKSGLDFLKESKVINNSVPVVVMTAYGDIDIAVQAMKLGATDFITKPFDPDMLCSMVKQIFDHRRVVDKNLAGRKSRSTRRIVTQSPKMEAILSQSLKLASLSTPVLILGESGTGKDLLARYLHENGCRASQPFVAINCGSTPKDLLESEFFGHEAGSFTGATEKRIGLFEIADKGTIFLDEIGNMPLELQVKLLRTLQESEIKRIGSTAQIKINSRVISATNSNLEMDIKNAKFRSDLYYRLSVMILEIPPLRERREDIPLLLNYFVKTIASDMSMEVPHVTVPTIKYLQSYDWPGNIRELENSVERAMIFSDGELTPECFEMSKNMSADEGSDEVRSLADVSASASKAAEVTLILKTLQQVNWNKTKAAKILDVSYKTLLNKIKEYSLE
ncbi:MAG: sigma-54-dependent Fis family transcriptional regulator [Proteobacteria bacterium]|nr:sigma-54-dependent Fis family transcriptional regulator [Pseudomonadota bacterium]